MTTVPLQIGIPGGPELLIVIGICVLLFGANKIPKLANASGKAMGEFKRGRTEIEDELTRGLTADPVDETETRTPEQFDDTTTTEKSS